MTFYTVLDHLSMETRKKGKTQAELSILRSEDGGHLPVFTSLARFSAFVEEYFEGDDSIEPAPFPIDPFELAEMMESLAENGELGFLIFDPAAVSPGVWRTERDPIPVAHYCRFMREIRPGIDRAVREHETRFGPAAPGSAAEKKSHGASQAPDREVGRQRRRQGGRMVGKPRWPAIAHRRRCSRRATASR